ncbi:hypothetical protein BDV98DRAFT_561923 [Pterulicium gracile]|uniref:Uncharacterized protein n=1 Tax=Pterulicium gracile TaxID=1884261 RepID=A0A5C3QXW1_9AGAR|nr:hypothetical protein BDV98DRAFT_561923 [Pterula gracilis]
MAQANCVLCGSANPAILHDQSSSFAASEPKDATLLVEELQEKIAAVEEAVKKLEGIRSHLYTELNAQHNASVPIHRLPDEILLSVFMILVEQCTEDDYLSDRQFTRAETNSVHPWASAAVCKRWRDIALASCLPWGAVVYHTGLAYWYGAHTEARRLSIQLQRADGPIPFASLRSQFTEEEMGEEHDFIDEDLDALGQFIDNVIPRCRRLELLGFIPEDLCPDSALDVNHLQSLLIQSEAWLPSLAFSCASQLESLTLQGISFYFLHDLVPWSRLKSLTIACVIKLEDILLILGLTSQLTSLSISSNIYGMLAEAPEDATVVLRNLRHLKFPFNHAYGQRMEKLLRPMEIPYLQTLDISLESSVFSRQTLPTSLAFIGQFNTSLTSLSVPWPLYDSLTTDEGLQFFSLLIALQSLRLRISSVANAVLRILTSHSSAASSPNTAPVCPALTELHCNPEEISPQWDQPLLRFGAWTSLRAMVESRLPVPGTNHLPSSPQTFLQLVSLGPLLSRDWSDIAGQEEEGADSLEMKDAFDWLVEANDAQLFKLQLTYAEDIEA